MRLRLEGALVTVGLVFLAWVVLPWLGPKSGALASSRRRLEQLGQHGLPSDATVLSLPRAIASRATARLDSNGMLAAARQSAGINRLCVDVSSPIPPVQPFAQQIALCDHHR